VGNNLKQQTRQKRESDSNQRRKKITIRSTTHRC